MKVHVSYWVKCFHFLQINTQMWNCWIICYFSDILRALHTVFCSSCTNLHSHQLHRGSLFSISSPTAIYFLVIAILMGVRLCLTVGFFCISLMISDVRVISWTCWPPVCFCWEIVYSDLLPIFFFKQLFFFRFFCYCVPWVIYIFWIAILYQIHDLFLTFFFHSEIPVLLTASVGVQQLFSVIYSHLGFPGGSVVKSLPAKQKMQIPSLGQGELLEMEMATHPVFLYGKPYGAWLVAVHGVTEESDAT